MSYTCIMYFSQCAGGAVLVRGETLARRSIGVSRWPVYPKTAQNKNE